MKGNARETIYRVVCAITIASLILSLVGSLLPPPSAQASALRDPIATSTPTAEATTEAMSTAAPSATAAASPTATTRTLTATAAASPVASRTAAAASPTAASSPTGTSAATATATPVASITPTATPTATATATVTPTATPTAASSAPWVEIGPAGGTMQMVDFGGFALPQGALAAPYQINWYAVEPRLARGLRRYHPAGPPIHLEALGSDARPASVSLKAAAVLSFKMDKFPATLPKKPAVRQLTPMGWESLPSSFDAGTKTLTIQLTELPVTLAVVDSSQPVSPATPDPSDPASIQLPDGYWALAAVDNSANLIFQKTTSAQSSAYWTSPVTVDTSASDPALVQQGSALGLLYARSDGTHKQVFLRTSADEGATWSAPTQLSSETSDVYQIQATSASGTAYVFWSLALSLSNNYASSPVNYRSSPDLESWSPVATVGQQVGPQGDFVDPSFDLKLLSSGSWLMSWTAPSASDPTDYSYPVIWAATSADLGSTSWSNAQELCIGLGGIFGTRWPTRPSIGQESGGTVYLSYGEYGYPSTWYDLYYKTSTDGGGSWVPAGTADGNFYQPGSADNSYLAATNGGTSRSYFNESGLLWYKDMPSGTTTQVQTAPPAPTVQPTPTDAESIDKPYSSTSRDPVITSTGSYTHSHTDMAIPGRGPAIAFARTYNGLDTRVSPMGPGWTHSYNVHLADPGDGSGNLILVGPRAGSDLYTKNADGSYTTPPGAYAALVKNADGTYTVTQQDQTVWSFGSDGKLTRITDRYGNHSDLTYNTSGQLTAVSDPAGRGSLSLSYDPTSGRLTSVSDWAGRTITYGYDSNGRLSTVKDPDNNTTTFAYDGTSQRLSSITDANGHTVVTMTYDTQGRVATQKDAMGLTTGQETTFSYVVNGDGTRQTTVTYPATSLDPSWHPQVIDSYDSSGHLVQKVSKPTSNTAEDVTEQRGYDANSDLAWTRDGRGNETDLCYDVDYTGAAVPGSRGNLTRSIDPAPSAGANNRPVTLFKYDAKNNVIETVSPNGVPSGTTATCSTDFSAGLNLNYATDSAYDANGVDLLSVTTHYTDPDLGAQTATTKFEYGDANNPGLVTRIIPPRGNTGASPDYSYATTMAYYGPGSEAGMLSSTTDPLGNLPTYSYDSVGRRTSMVDPDGNASGGVPADHTWSYSYDNEDRLLSTTAPAPASGGSALVTHYQYDPVGNRTVVIDANGQVTKYVYDVRDSLAEVHQSTSPWTDPNTTPSPDMVTAYQYDNAGNLSRVVRASGDSSNERATDYAYDGLGRVRTETQYPSWPSTSPTLVTQYTYDLAGNRQTVVDPLGKTTTYGYDALNRLTSVGYSDGTTPNVSYGYDADGNRTSMADGTGSTTYSYDEARRLTSVTSPGPKTVGYRYDTDGNRTKVIYPDGTSVSYSFDKGSRLSSLSDWASRQVGYQYYPDGSLKQTTNFNGTTGSYSYDDALRLTQVLNQEAANTISKHAYTLDNLGNRTQEARGSTGAQNALWSWGGNSSGELGDGTTNDRGAPAPVAGLGEVSQIAAGWGHTLALLADGTVSAWGGNSSGQLGDGTTTDRHTPVQVVGLSGVTAVAAGWNHSIALRSDGTVWTWGLNELGQLGDGTATSRSQPAQVNGLTDVVAIAAGGEHSLAVKSDGTVWTWGRNISGELGDGSTTTRYSPVEVRRLTGVIAVAGGDEHSLAVKSDGTVWGWGWNGWGQVGDGTDRDRKDAVQVVGLSGATAVAAGWHHSLALKSDGTVWAWGGNDAGQLGDGSRVNHWTPVQVPNVTGVRSIAAGYFHSLAAKGTAGAWAWGGNDSGQLGGSSSDICGYAPCSLSPIQVSVLTGVTKVAGGDEHSLAIGSGAEGQPISYQYDGLSRLTTASAGNGATSYTYDPIGNRISMASTSYTYDRADRITATGSTTYTVDANGNLTAKGSDTFSYDQANRLKSASVSGTSSTYVYDGDGKRGSKTVGGTQTSYTYDVNASLPVLLDDGTHKYVWGLGLAFAVDSSGNPLVYHTDGLGSVRALTDASGSVVQTYQYDEYGNVTSTSGSITQPFGYTGEVSDAETGFIYVRARYYDPETGRFASRDSFSGQMREPNTLGRYVYAEDNPSTDTDPDGYGKIGTVIRVLKVVAEHFVPKDAVSVRAAQLIREAGGNVRVFGGTEKAREAVASQIEHGAFPQGEVIRHGPHGESPIFRPHYQTVGEEGHTFYAAVPLAGASELLKNLTVSHYTKDWPGPLQYVGTAVDFFNPVSDVTDIMDLAQDILGGSEPTPNKK